MKMKLGVAAMGLSAALIISYGFARLGEPQAIWLWRDMLGMM